MQETGTLAVRVYTSQAQIPLEGATVVVTAQEPGGRMRLLSIQTTNSSGEIRPIQIQTPETGESTSPNGAGAPAPFALCDVWAEQPGYAMLRMEGVQIFPGVETIQNIQLQPLSQGQCSLQQRQIREISPQSL